jgi:release factor glutamine methyltransferase
MTGHTTTIREALSAAIKFLEKQEIAGARLDAELLLAYILQKDRAWLLAHDDAGLSEYQVADYESIISRRFEHVPVVHLTGTREFYGLDMHITPDVLTPRVETEQMVEWAIQYARPDSALIDIGTGSGAIAVAIATQRPDLQVSATNLIMPKLNLSNLTCGRP